MLLEIDLFTKLKTDVNLVNNRVFAVAAPQNVVKPYIVYTQISGERENSHDGATGLATGRYQFSIFSTTYLSTKNVAKEIKDSLQGFTGLMGSTLIGSITYSDEVDFYETDTTLFHCAADYTIQYIEE